jgi:hypothetical protein
LRAQFTLWARGSYSIPGIDFSPLNLASDDFFFLHCRFSTDKAIGTGLPARQVWILILEQRRRHYLLWEIEDNIFPLMLWSMVQMNFPF